jgi:hypothetical protein
MGQMTGAVRQQDHTMLYRCHPLAGWLSKTVGYRWLHKFGQPALPRWQSSNPIANGNFFL